MSFDIICFDCDSTLSKIEGIDELGRRVNMLDEMAILTNAAMNGEWNNDKSVIIFPCLF